jgi:HK97 gp10 family phage protein
MYEVKIGVNGIKELMEDLARKPDALNKALLSAIKESADVVDRAVKQNVPVDTGTMRNSVTKKVNGLMMEVGPTVPYSIFVELGHHLRNGKFLKGQYFMRKTYLQVQGKIRDIFKRKISDELNANKKN